MAGPVELPTRRVDEGDVQDHPVMLALTQRRQHQPGQAQPMVEVGAEPSRRDRLCQIGAPGRDDAQVERLGAFGPNPLHLALLDHPQQRGLHAGRQAIDPVEQQRSPARSCDRPRPRQARLRHAVGGVTEQLDRRRGIVGQRRAIDRDERAGAPRPLAVQQQRGEFLARPRLALDQHVDIRGGQAADRIAQLDDRGALADQRAFRLARLHRGTQPPILDQQPAALERARDRRDQMVGRERLGQEVERSVPQGRHRHRHVAMTGDQDHRQVGIERADAGEQLQPVHPRHPDIGNDRPVEIRRQRGQRRLRPGKGAHRQPGQLQRLHRRKAQHLVVLDEQHSLCAHAALAITPVSTSA